MNKTTDKRTTTPSRQSGLKWNGKAFLVDVPARDLTHQEVNQFGGYDLLLRSGGYDLPEAEAPASAPEDHKETEK